MGTTCGLLVSCGPSPSPLHSTGGCGSPLSYGGHCDATCDRGYTAGAKSARISCKVRGQTGYYDGSLDCKPVSCGDAPQPAHADAAAGSSHCKGMRFSQTCKMVCDDCYRAGARELDFTCQWDTHHSHSASDLNCEAVSCGSVPPPDAHSSPSNRDGWEGEQRCSEPKKTFSAKCDAGWTGGVEHDAPGITNIQATVECLATGAYSLELDCKKVPCHEPAFALPAGGVPARGCPADGCPSNIIIGDDNGECGDAKKDLEETCTVACRTGFTHAVPVEATKTFTCVADGDKSGDTAPRWGIWAPGAPHAGAELSSELSCEAVKCPPLPPDPNTFDPLNVEVAPSNNITVHAMDREQLQQEYQCQAHYMGFGDVQSAETPAADGTCHTECMPSWYPKENPTQRQLKWVCQPPAEGGGWASGKPAQTHVSTQDVPTVHNLLWEF